MSETMPREKWFRISLRELLVVVSLVALSVASLKFANDFWLAVVAGLAMIALFASLIIAAVDRGPRQAFAIGFALTMIAYGIILTTGQRTRGSGGSVNSENIEFDQWAGHLPTTRLLGYFHMAVERNEWRDMNGKVVPGYAPNQGQGINAGGFGGSFAASVYFQEVPPREIFMPIGHCWWALLLGCVGGYSARFVYKRRIRDEQNRPAHVS
jgi:hypothetical protein